MEVVIKLDDKDYEALNKVGHNGLEFNDTLEGRVYRAIANGTPLIPSDKSNEISIDNIPSCNSCVHNGTWDCITCKGFDRYKRGGNK